MTQPPTHRLRADPLRNDPRRWPPRRARLHPLAHPLRPLLERLALEPSWPRVERYGALLASPGLAVRFASPPRRRGPEPVAYDSSIVDSLVVPTREHHWHDLFNACIWSVFPLAKWALHGLQRRYLEGSVERSRRAPEHDLLAMLDEGGALCARGEPLESGAVLFGHALYEHLEVGEGSVRVRVLRVALEGTDRSPGAWDRALAALIAREGHREAASEPLWLTPASE